MEAKVKVNNAKYVTLRLGRKGGIVVDKELNSESENPVTNSAVTQAITDAEERISKVESKPENGYLLRQHVTGEFALGFSRYGSLNNVLLFQPPWYEEREAYIETIDLCDMVPGGKYIYSGHIMLCDFQEDVYNSTGSQSYGAALDNFGTITLWRVTQNPADAASTPSEVYPSLDYIRGEFVAYDGTKYYVYMDVSEDMKTNTSETASYIWEVRHEYEYHEELLAELIAPISYYIEIPKAILGETKTTISCSPDDVQWLYQNIAGGSRIYLTVESSDIMFNASAVTSIGVSKETNTAEVNMVVWFDKYEFHIRLHNLGDSATIQIIVTAVL